MSSHSGTLVVRELMWVFVADPPLIDNAIYAMWVEGLPETAVSQALQNSYRNVENELILKHVEDQYKLFVELRHHLASPWLFDKHRSMFHIDGQLRSEMLEKYYTFDGPIVREFLGKRLNDKMKPGLNDMSVKLGISPRSTTRQFENIRRIYKRAMNATSSLYGADGDDITEVDEDVDGMGVIPSGGAVKSQDLAVDLMGAFQFSKRLARRYARIVYAAVHSFDLTKKKLAHLKYKDLDLVISYMVKHWGQLPGDGEHDSSSNRGNTSSRGKAVVGSERAGGVVGVVISNATASGNDSSEAEDSQTRASSSAERGSMDVFPMLAPHPKIVSRLNQVKAIFASRKEEAITLTDEVRQKLGDWTGDGERASQKPDSNRQRRAGDLLDYKFLKSFVSLGTSLGNPKEYKKIISDIADQIVQPCIDVQLDSNELEELFRLVLIEGQAFLTASLGASAKPSSKRHISDAWSSFLTGLKKISLVLYEASPRK